MSTATLERSETATGRDTAPSFVQLVKVELRKMTNTRAGFWLLLAIGAITALVAVLILALGDAGDRDLRSVMEGAVQPAAFILPVVGILLVTSEWSQRTNLTTFALVPDRMRVIAAKVGAAFVVSILALLFARAVSTVAVLVAEQSFDGDVMNLPGTILGQDTVYILANVLIGVAFGAVLLSSAPAIVIFFILPTVFGGLGALLDSSVFDWLDTSQTMAPLPERTLDGEEWAQLGTSLLVWLALPLALGVQRIRRSEIN